MSLSPRANAGSMWAMSDGAVLITGGSGGIGGESAKRFARHGYRPIVAYARNRQAADAVADRTGGLSVQLDLSQASSIDAAIENLETTAPDLAGVVLAGSPPPQLIPFGKIDESDLRLHLDVQVIGTHRLLASLVRKFFRTKKNGFVVGVLSAATGLGSGRAKASLGAYVIGKYGRAGVLALAQQDYPWLRVRTVSSSYTDTALLPVFDGRYVEQLGQRGEVAPPDEVARTIVEAAVGSVATQR